MLIPRSSVRLQPCFNPRPPRGGRLCMTCSVPSSAMFQSAPPARGAMSSVSDKGGCESGFNPRPPRGGRFEMSPLVRCERGFNPRPPRGGRCAGARVLVGYRGVSIRAPARGAIRKVRPHGDVVPVSIRAPRAGGDVGTLRTPQWGVCFNPRPPRGGRFESM